MTAISVHVVNFSDEGHVGRGYSPPWNKVLGARYGWMETTAEHSATQMVPAGHRKCCYEWNRSGCVNSEYADQNMWILPQQVTTSISFFALFSPMNAACEHREKSRASGVRDETSLAALPLRRALFFLESLLPGYLECILETSGIPPFSTHILINIVINSIICVAQPVSWKVFVMLPWMLWCAQFFQVSFNHCGSKDPAGVSVCLYVILVRIRSSPLLTSLLKELICCVLGSLWTSH